MSETITYTIKESKPPLSASAEKFLHHCGILIPEILKTDPEAYVKFLKYVGWGCHRASEKLEMALPILQRELPIDTEVRPSSRVAQYIQWAHHVGSANSPYSYIHGFDQFDEWVVVITQIPRLQDLVCADKLSPQEAVDQLSSFERQYFGLEAAYSYLPHLKDKEEYRNNFITKYYVPSWKNVLEFSEQTQTIIDLAQTQPLVFFEQ